MIGVDVRGVSEPVDPGRHVHDNVVTGSDPRFHNRPFSGPPWTFLYFR